MLEAESCRRDGDDLHPSENNHINFFLRKKYADHEHSYERWHRTKQMAEIYDCGRFEVGYSVSGHPCLNLNNSQVKKMVRDILEKYWRQGMILKSSMDVFLRGERSLGVRSFRYGIRRGDVLLALAGAGLLPT